MCKQNCYKFLKDFDNYNISFEEHNSVLIDFICDVLMTEGNLKILNISSEIEMEYRYYLTQAQSYLNHNITNEELTSARLACWKTHDVWEYDNANRHLARIIVFCLYDEFDHIQLSYNNKYDPVENFLLCTNVLDELGEGYCCQFTNYLKGRWL